MAIIKPFKGIRPNQEYANKVASKPYDVLNKKEAKILADTNPYSFLHIIRPEVDLPDETNPYDITVYKKAKENYENFFANEILFQDAKPTLYLYEQEMNGHVQTGIVACSSVQDYFNDIIKKHEYTRPVKEQDRINHIKNTQLQTGPIFMTYPDIEEINSIVNSIRLQKPEYNFVADDKVRHTFWVIEDDSTTSKLVELFKNKVPYTYIADGHHRAASSAKVGQEMVDNNPNNTGDEPYNYFLTVLFPSSQLKIIDYNRAIIDLNGLSEESFLNKVEKHFEVNKTNGQFKPSEKGQFGMYLNGQWYSLLANKEISGDDDPVKSLDVYILQQYLLDEVLGVKDPRTDNRIDFVGGIRGLGELEKRVNSGEMAVAFSLFPVTIEELIAIADSGNVMPPKSTWFEPKLRSGLVVHKIID